MVEHVRPGDLITADAYNKVADEAASGSSPRGVGIGSQSGTGNPVLYGNLETLVWLFELTEDITYPASGNDVPYAENCKHLGYLHATEKYDASDSQEETVYFPTITEFTNGEPPALIDGDRVHAAWNAQSGRWEAVALAGMGGGGGGTHGGPYWGTLDGTLSKCSSQTVSIISDCSSETDTGYDVTAWDMLLATGDTLASGTKVLVQWFPYLSKWFVTAAECD